MDDKNYVELLRSTDSWNTFQQIGILATKDDLGAYVPFASGLPANQRYYTALVPGGDTSRIYFYSAKDPIGENVIGYITLTK